MVKNLVPNISYIEETHPMGTGGSLAFLDPLSLSENILVMNGDVLTDLDARQMLDFHVDQGAMGTMGVRTTPWIYPMVWLKQMVQSLRIYSKSHLSHSS